MNALPPCGLYRTRRAVAGIPAGQLVFFHNHGEPGPGLYLPASWHQNRARFHSNGATLTNPAAETEALEPLPAEGFYRVEAPFHCCDRKCRLFEPNALVQLGYNAQGSAILFVPEWGAAGFSLPERGTVVSPDRIPFLIPLKVPGTSAGAEHIVH